MSSRYKTRAYLLALLLNLLSAQTIPQQQQQLETKVKVRLGEDAILPCNFNGHVDGTDIIWLHRGTTIAIGTHKIVQGNDRENRYAIQDLDPGSPRQNDFSMRIKNVRINDHGEFSCQNIAGKVIEHKIRVEVIAPPEEIKITARGVYQDESLNRGVVSVVKDEHNSLECRVERSRPQASVKWLKNGLDFSRSQVKEAGKDKQAEGLFWSSAVLNLLPSDINQLDEYSCIIEHPTLEKPDVRPIVFDILIKPTVEVTTPNKFAREQQNIEITCDTSNSAVPPAHEFKFFIDDEQINDDTTSSTLLLPSVTRQLNTQAITCTATNRAGISNVAKLSTDSFIVAYGPELSYSADAKEVIKQGANFELKCPVNSAPAPKISWYKSGEEFPVSHSSSLTLDSIKFSQAGSYKCHAFNEFLQHEVVSGVTNLKVEGKPRFNEEYKTVEQVYELSKPTLELQFKSTPFYSDISVQWLNLSTPIFLTESQRMAKFLGGHIEVQEIDSPIEDSQGVIKIFFNDHQQVPSLVEVTVSNSFGGTVQTILPLAGDTIGRIAAIVGGSIAGIILIMAAIVAGLYYKKRQIRARTYSPGSIVRSQSESNTPLCPGKNNNLYASSLSSSQRDDGYITEQSHHNSYNEKANASGGGTTNNDSSSDSIDVSKATSNQQNSELKVLPPADHIQQLPPPIEEFARNSVGSSSSRSHASRVPMKASPALAVKQISPKQQVPSGSSTASSYHPDRMRSTYTSHFQSNTLQTGSTSSNEYPGMAYKTMTTARRKTKSGSTVNSKPRSLTQV